jgi:hypothetical protein
VLNCSIQSFRHASSLAGPYYLKVGGRQPVSPGSQDGIGIELDTTMLLWVAGVGVEILDEKALATAPAKTRPNTETRTISFIVWLPRRDFLDYELVYQDNSDYTRAKS